MSEHAPLITREITRRPAAWYTPEIKQAKRDKRGAERRWRKTSLTEDRNSFVEQSKFMV